MILLIEKDRLSAASIQQLTGRHSKRISHILHLLILILPRKHRNSSVQFRQNAASAPDIDTVIIRNAKRDLRRSVIPRLYIRIQSLLLKTARPEIYDFYAGFVVLLQQDVLRLQVTVNNLLVPKKLQTD